MSASLTKAALAAAATMSLTFPAVAQDTARTDGATVTDAQVTTERHEDDDDFPWGLLGLLGLAGLLGRKRNDGDIHVDARRDTTRP